MATARIDVEPTFLVRLDHQSLAALQRAASFYVEYANIPPDDPAYSLADLLRRASENAVDVVSLLGSASAKAA